MDRLAGGASDAPRGRVPPPSTVTSTSASYTSLVGCRKVWSPDSVMEPELAAVPAAPSDAHSLIALAALAKNSPSAATRAAAARTLESLARDISQSEATPASQTTVPLDAVPLPTGPVDLSPPTDNRAPAAADAVKAQLDAKQEELRRVTAAIERLKRIKRIDEKNECVSKNEASRKEWVRSQRKVQTEEESQKKAREAYRNYLLNVCREGIRATDGWTTMEPLLDGADSRDLKTVK